MMQFLQMKHFFKKGSNKQSIVRNNESFRFTRLPQKNLSANVNSNIYAMLAQNMQIHYKIIPQK